MVFLNLKHSSHSAHSICMFYCMAAPDWTTPVIFVNQNCIKVQRVA